MTEALQIYYGKYHPESVALAAKIALRFMGRKEELKRMLERKYDGVFGFNIDETLDVMNQSVLQQQINLLMI